MKRKQAVELLSPLIFWGEKTNKNRDAQPD